MPFIILVIVVLAFVGLVVGFRGRRWARRRRLLSAPLPGAWLAVLERSVPLYRRLPDDLRQQLHGCIQVFLAEKHFEGVGGLEITDEIRVSVAAQACLLLLNRRTDFFPLARSIVVYPGAYVAKHIQQLESGVVTEQEDALLGESWDSGTVVLAWDQVNHLAREIPAGQNVVLHEFAHQLDQEDGQANGAPRRAAQSGTSTWARTLGREFQRLQRQVRRGRRTLLDDYGATDPAEFFAVATESFFEAPLLMKSKHPALYAELQGFYHVDPAAWT